MSQKSQHVDTIYSTDTGRRRGARTRLRRGEYFRVSVYYTGAYGDTSQPVSRHRFRRLTAAERAAEDEVRRNNDLLAEVSIRKTGDAQ